MRICTSCGFENPEDAAFCGNCGAALGQAEAPQTSGQPEETERLGSKSGQQEAAAGLGEEPVKTEEDDFPPQPLLSERVSSRRRKPSGAVGVLLKAMGLLSLAVICFAAGGMARQMIPATARTIALRVHHDSEPEATAVCYDAEGCSDIGKVTVTGHQGKVLDTADQVKEGCYLWIASCQSLVYLDSQGDLYVKILGGEAVQLAQKTDWSSLNPKISDDGRLLVYRDLSRGEKMNVVYDLKAGEEMAVLEMSEQMPYYDADSGTLYYINSDSTLTAIDDSGEKQRVKGDISDFKVQDGVVFCNTASKEKNYVIRGETEISLDGYNQSAFGVLDQDQYVVLLADIHSGEQQLVMCAPGLEPVVLDRGPLLGWRSSSTDMERTMEYMVYAKASNCIYYVKNGSLYYIVIPELDEKALSDQQLFEEAVDVTKEKLASGINEWNMPSMDKDTGAMEGENVTALPFQCSPNGENLAWINSKDELNFYCYPLDGSHKADKSLPEPLTVDRNVKDFWVWDHSLVYVTDGWELKKLPLTPGVFPEDTQDAAILYTMEGLEQSQAEAEGDPDTQPDEDGSQGFLTKTSSYGDYIAVADPSAGLLQVFNIENEVITLDPHMDAHDWIDVLTREDAWSSTVWNSKLTLEDIVGFYSIKGEDGAEILMEINSQGQLDAIYSLLPSVFEIKGDFTWEEKNIHSLELKITVDRMAFWDQFGDLESDLNLYDLESLRSYLDSSSQEPSLCRIELRDNSLVFVNLHLVFVDLFGNLYEDLLGYPLGDLAEQVSEVNLTKATASQFAYAKKILDQREQGAEEREQYIRQEQDRIREEKRRQEEEEKRQALITQAKSFYNYGIYLSKGTRLFTTTSLSSASTRTTAKNETWTVYDYQVDVTSNRIWLKVKDSSNQYFWVYR